MLKRTVFLGLTLLCVGLTLNGCSSDDDPAQPTSSAKIRVVHASPDVGAVDIYIQGSSTPWQEDVAYGTATTYTTGSPRTVIFEFRAVGANVTTDPIFTSDPIDLASGASITAVTAGLLQSADPADEFRLLVYSDYYQTTADANVRTVHAGSDAPAATVFVGETELVLGNNLARWEESGRGGVAYETGRIFDIGVAAGGGLTSFRVPELEAKSTYFFILTGLIAGQGAQSEPFNLLIVGPGGVEDLEPVAPRDFRLVHAVPDGGTVDTYVVGGLGDDMDRILMMSGMVYGDVTAYGQAEDLRLGIVEMYTAGADPDLAEPVFTAVGHVLEEAASTTIFTAGIAASEDEATEVRLFSLADDFPMPGVGETVARVVHAVPNLDALRVDFGDDGSVEGTVERFTGNSEGPIFLTAGVGLTMAVREGLAPVGVFTTPELAADREHYLVLTGIKNGVPDFSLLTLTEEGSLGFTPQDGTRGF